MAGQDLWVKYLRAFSLAAAAMLSGILPSTVSIIARCSKFSCVWKRASPAGIEDPSEPMDPSAVAVNLMQSLGNAIKRTRLTHTQALHVTWIFPGSMRRISCSSMIPQQPSLPLGSLSYTGQAITCGELD